MRILKVYLIIVKMDSPVDLLTIQDKTERKKNLSSYVKTLKEIESY